MLQTLIEKRGLRQVIIFNFLVLLWHSKKAQAAPALEGEYIAK